MDSSIGVVRSRRDIFYEKGIEHSLRISSTKEAKDIWKVECPHSKDRKAYNRRLGWTDEQINTIKSLYKEYRKGSDSVFKRCLELRELEGRVGVFAKENVGKNSVIGIYTGEAMTSIQAGSAEVVNYQFEVTKFSGDPQVVIDAQKKGNWSRFLNHSGRPNLHIALFGHKRTPMIIFFAKNSIEKGSELTINFGSRYCEQFSIKSLPPAKRMSRPISAVEAVASMDVKLDMVEAIRWNNPQFLVTAVHEAISCSIDTAARREKLTQLINEKRVECRLEGSYTEELSYRLLNASAAHVIDRSTMEQFDPAEESAEDDIPPTPVKSQRIRNVSWRNPQFLFTEVYKASLEEHPHQRRRKLVELINAECVKQGSVVSFTESTAYTLVKSVIASRVGSDTMNKFEWEKI